MDIAIPIYDDFTALDAVGPYEVLSRLPGARVRFLSAEPGAGADRQRHAHAARRGRAGRRARARGAGGPRRHLGVAVRARPPVYVDWIRAAHETAEWTTSVCSGALLLGAAGILDGLKATTHWLDYEELASFGALPVADAGGRAGAVITSAGVSSGIDMALTLAARIAGDDVAKAIQLGIEYDPKPPFSAGSVAMAGERIENMVRAAVAARDEASRGRVV